MAKQISGIDIEKLWYIPCSVTLTVDDIDGDTVKGWINNSACKEIKNVHQDTWQVEESEASQDSYKNQLTGQTYRMGAKNMGDISANFTIGRYDYQTKADLLGGTATATSWKRARGVVEMRYTLIAKTEDAQYMVLPYTNFNTREANQDGAIGLAVVAMAMEPENEALSSEYWFDAEEIEG